MNRLSLAQVAGATVDPQRRVALHHGRPVSHADFVADIKKMLARLQAEPRRQRWGLFCEDAYPFAVALLALLHSGRQVVLPGNLTASTRQRLAGHIDGLISDTGTDDIALNTLADWPAAALPLPVLDPAQSRITIFTSGSTGEAKAIVKQLAQLEAELNSLEAGWGAQIGDAAVIATVSHQHIYGLLFRVLWPLAAGRCFYSEQVLDNGLVFHHADASTGPLVWVASPAHLKRLYDGLAWPSVADTLRCVFSSGGPLPAEAAAHVADWLGEAPVEVFGSSETGGIAFRQQQQGNTLWQPLAGVAVRAGEDGRLQVRSPHVNRDDSWYQADDAVRITADGRFELLGRLDRIVKLEEKRLSLVEMEQAIIATGLAAEVFCWVRPAEQGRLRQTLTATLVASPAGQALLDSSGRSAVTKLLKSALAERFELSLIPRKWRFVPQLPVNAQSKIDIPAIEALMNDDTTA